MPIYEYECEHCGLFEAIQSASDKPLKQRPDCSEKKCPKSAHRLISQSSFHLKGTGWYKTDYASSNSSSGKSKKSESNSESKSSDSSSSEKQSSETKGSKLKARGGGGNGGCGSGCGCH